MSINVFPNPTNNNIEVPLDFPVRYSLNNIQGQEVQKGILDNVMDVSNLPKGKYVLRLLKKNVPGYRSS